MRMARLYLAVGLGGMIGASLRFLMSLLLESNSHTLFPWDTFFVNVTGAFLLTFLLFLPLVKEKIGSTLFTALTTGLLGSYTTFSLIIVELHTLFHHAPMIASLYLMMTIVVGLCSSYLGYISALGLSKKGAR